MTSTEQSSPADGPDPRQWRVQFDADVAFANGGGLQAQEFRLDAPGPDITTDDVAELFVRHLGLLMVGSVRISNVHMLREPHKGGRGVATPHRAGRRIVDLSHPIRHDMVARTGTYLDSPFHRFDDGPDLAGLPLDGLVDVDGLVVRTLGTGNPAIDRSTLLPYDVTGRAVLIHAGWSRHWGTDAYGAGGHPHLTAGAAAWLAERRPALVGIDSPDIDDTEALSRPAHTTLLAAGIPIVEHMCGLDQLPPDGFRFHAAPPAAERVGPFTVRAYAIVPDSATGD